MNNIIYKDFNELFLNEISKFDSRKYAYDVFFNCEWERFREIAQGYESQFGTGAYSYMMKTKNSWQSGYVRPNSSSTYNIIASTASTFTIEEQFLEAYTQLAKYIKSGFPKQIQLKEVNGTFDQIINKIDSFNLERSTYYAKNIYKGSQLEFQKYVQNLFKFYTKIIFENLNKDIELFVKVYEEINTSFLTTSYYTYLYGVEINIHDIANKKFALKKTFDLTPTISYEDLIVNRIATFSLDKVSEIAKAYETTKIDSLLTLTEIDKIVSKKKELEVSKNNGIISLNLKTNSGILKINLRILSPKEKAILIARILLFTAAVSLLVYYSFIQTTSYFIFVGVFLALSFLIIPIRLDIANLIKDIFKFSN